MMLISEYRAYDVENGLEFHQNGTVATRQELREQIRQAVTTLSKELNWFSLIHSRIRNTNNVRP